MNSITKNLAELGTKIQTGAAEFAEKHELEKKVQPIKQKAEELTAKAGEAIASATKGKEKPAETTTTTTAEGEESVDNFTNEPRAAADGDSEEPKKRNIRDSITGIASRIKPGFVKIEDGSIGDILLKAKSKVFGADSEEAKAAGADSTAIVVGDESYDDVKSDVESIASELEDTGKDVSNKEKVQKLLVPLLTQLKVAQDKFTAMVEARKKKKEEEAAASAEAGGEGDAKPKNNLLNTAETAVKKAFENAEKIARDVAKKAGIFDKKGEEATTTTTDAEAPDTEGPDTEATGGTEETKETAPETTETVETPSPTEAETKVV